MTADPLEPLTELPEVFEASEAARASVDALLRDLRSPELRTRVPEVTAAALRRAARASALLEPDVATADPSWAEDRSSFGPPFIEDAVGRTGAASLRLTTELSSLSSVWHNAPRQALARLHTMAAAGEADDSVLGRPRTDAATSARLDGLVGLVAGGSAATTTPAVVVAAVVHGELMALQPFASRNGLVARAASRLVLLDRGLDPQAASVPEEGHLELGLAAYEQALASYRTGTPEGVATWLVHCATAVALGGRVGREVAEAVRLGRPRDGG